MGAVHHFQNLIIIDAILEVFGNSLELLEINNSVLVLIEKFENSLDSVLGLAFTNLTGSNVNKFVEVMGLLFSLRPLMILKTYGLLLSTPNSSRTLLISGGSMVPLPSSSKTSKVVLSSS